MQVSQASTISSNGLMAAAVDQAKADADEASLALAFDLLRRRHRGRPDVRAKLLQLAERREGRTGR